MHLLELPAIPPITNARVVRGHCSMSDTDLRREKRTADEIRDAQQEYKRLWVADARAKKADHYKRMARIRLLRAKIEKLELFGANHLEKINKVRAELERLESVK